MHCYMRTSLMILFFVTAINADISSEIKHIPMRNTGIGGTSTSVENIPFPANEIQFRTLSIIKAEKTDDFVKDKIEGVLSGNTTTDKYFYHSDHLGSASWITDGTGTPVQHLQYTAWGEPLLDQRTTDYNERYTFSGKERDEETGLNYFGFRYLVAKAQIWTGVDPLSDKYPSTSPYAYCNNNPVMLVDPDGREIDPASQKEWDRQMDNIDQTISILENPPHGLLIDEREERIATLKNFRTQIKQLEDSKQVYALNPNFTENSGELTYDAKTDIITINYDGTALFGHEGAHGLQVERGELTFSLDGRPLGLDIFDEVEAYKIQAAFDPGMGSLRDISPNWVRDLKDKEGQYLYHTISAKKIDANMQSLYPNVYNALKCKY